jgi:hypothetical protein
MPKKHQQFLGSKPGSSVELVDEEKSPFRVRTEEGFEFLVSSEDFRNYYEEEGSPTPAKWKLFVTDKNRGLIETRLAGEAVNLINSFKNAFQDFTKARHFLRELLCDENRSKEISISSIRQLLQASARFPELLSDKDLWRVLSLDPQVRDLLAGNDFGMLDWPLSHPSVIDLKDETMTEPQKAGPPKTPRVAPQKMKNIDLKVQGDQLTIDIDLSKEFGPSKSGKTIIVASTEGNKTVPGRNEKIGLNVYKEMGLSKRSGNKKSFRNMEMSVTADDLSIVVDLSQELGPSKSGKTIIIASTGGNQLVYGRTEKIGLNVYKTI